MIARVASLLAVVGLLVSPALGKYRVAIYPDPKHCKYQAATEIFTDDNTPPAAVPCRPLINTNGAAFPASMIQVDYTGTLGQTPGEIILAYKDYNCTTEPIELTTGCSTGLNEEPVGFFAIEIKPLA